MPSEFETTIDEFVVNTKERLLAVTRQSIEDLVEEVQTPDSKGGRMRVDTGFLRHTGLSSLNSAPSGPNVRDKDRTYLYSGEPVNITLSRMEIGDTFYFGWTANYARHREVFDGFLEKGLQNWQKHVDNAVSKLKQRDV